MSAAAATVIDRLAATSPDSAQSCANEVFAREAAARLWTPPLPLQLTEAFVDLEPSAIRLLWAVWCVPPRYRLSPALWRKEARLSSVIALKTKLRRLVRADLLTWRDVRGRGLVFDGQTWRPRPDGLATFWALRLTPLGESRVRLALQRSD